MPVIRFTDAVNFQTCSARMSDHPRKTRRTERGDLIEYFYLAANKERDGQTPTLILRFQTFTSTAKDLYYLRSICENSQQRGGPWAKTFWGSLKINIIAKTYDHH